MTVTQSTKMTPPEEQVAILHAYGHTNAEIAAQLSISVRTAEMHRAAAMQTLGDVCRAQLVRWALDHELLQ